MLHFLQGIIIIIIIIIIDYIFTNGGESSNNWQKIANTWLLLNGNSVKQHIIHLEKKSTFRVSVFSLKIKTQMWEK